MNGFWEMASGLLPGLLVTLQIFGWTLLFSLPLGFIVCFGSKSKIAPLRWLTKGFILLMRGTPLMLQVIFFFYGMPFLGLPLGRMTAAVLAFSLNYSAYFAEIFRSGIQSVARGQYEAADVLGLSGKQTFFRIVLPQVIKTVMPPIGNEVIVLVKDTALVYVIAISDLLRAAQVQMMGVGNILPLLVATIFYLVLTTIFTAVLNRIEKRFNYYRIV